VSPLPAWTPVAARPTPTATPVAEPKKPQEPATLPRLDSREEQRYRIAMRSFLRSDPTPEQKRAMRGLMLSYRSKPAGSRKRQAALMKIQREAFGRPRPLPPVRTGPPKGIAAPTPAAAPVTAPVETPTPSATPTASAAVTPAG
jgi:hypothetical protein